MYQYVVYALFLFLGPGLQIWLNICHIRVPRVEIQDSTSFRWRIWTQKCKRASLSWYSIILVFFFFRYYAFLVSILTEYFSWWSLLLMWLLYFFLLPIDNSLCSFYDTQTISVFVLLLPQAKIQKVCLLHNHNHIMYDYSIQISTVQK